MEPEPKRIKLTRIDDGNGEKLSTLEKNTNMYNKLLNSYEESLKDLKPALFSSLFAKARKYFENCDTSYTQSSEFRRLLQNPKSLQPLQHLEALFNNFKKNKKISAKKSSTSKNDGETPDTNETGTVSSEVYNKDLFQKFLDIFKERKLSQGSYVDIEKYIVRAWDSFNKCKSSYKKSAAFEELLRRAIDLSAVDPGIQMTVVLDELKFNKKVVRKKQAVGNKVEEAGCSSSTAAEQQPGCSTSTAAADSASEENQTQKNETDEDDEDELAGLEPEVRKNVRRLENLLRKVNVKIKHLEEREVDFSKEDDENSAYMKLDRFYRRFDEIFKKICKLKKQKADAGRAVKRNVTFSGGEIEKAVEKHYNKTNQFPDFHDILKITKEVKKKEKLTPNALHSIAQRVFEEFGRLLQRRRIHDVYESACYYLTTSHDPADEDPELRARLEENYEKFKDSEKKVIDMYADKSQGIEPEEVGSSVSNDEAENDDNKNCDDSDDSSDNHSNYPEKQESTVMNYDDDTVIDNEGEGKLQCESDSKGESAADSNREKACSSKNIPSNPGKSSNACTSKDANKLGKSSIASSSKDSKVGEKDRDSPVERRDDGDEIRSKKSSSKCVEVDEEKRDSSVESRDELKAAGRDAIETSVKVNDSIEKKESNKLLNEKEGKSLSNSTKNCESVNVEKREEIREIDLSSTKSTTNGCSISGPGDCRSKIADEDSCSLPSKKVENEKTVPINETIKRTSPSKSVESRIRDDRCSKSESSPSKSESDRKRKFSDENVTRDEHDNKRPKSPEQIVEILPTDDIEVIEVSYCSANRTNKENLKKSNNLNQKTDNVRIQNCDKKTLNSSISDYFPRKNANPMSSDDKSRSNTVQSFNKISAVTSHMRNNGTSRSSNASGAISRSNNSSVTNNLSTNHIRNHKTPAMMLNNSTFSNSSNSSSSPIITSAYSLANRCGDNSSSNTKPSASLPRSQNNNHHQRKDCTSWSQAVTKYRVPRAAVVSSTSTSRSVASSHPIPKDIIDLSDEGDDTSDVSIISEVRTNKPDPGNHDLLKMLDGNTIKYISGEKTKEMLKHGNVKVFSRLKTKQTLNETKSDSVITLD